MLPFRHIAKVFLDSLLQMAKPPQGVNLPWWGTFNKTIGGLRENEITLLCAPTGAGKTQFLSCISAQLLSQNIPHFVAPVETGDSDFVIRVLSSLESKDFNTGEPISVDVLERLNEKYSSLFNKSCLYLSTHDNRVPIEEMINTLKFHVQKNKIKVALLDNLNFFLSITSSQLEKAEMDYAIHEFVMAAKKLPIHIILVVHPRKTEKGRVESEFDIKGSSTAVQECSNVLLFNRPSEKHLEKGYFYTDREAVFRKIRKRGMNVGVPIFFGFHNTRYKEINEAKP